MRISDYHRREQLQCLREARWVRDGHPASVPEGDEEEQDTCSPSGEDQRPYQASHANGTRAESPSKAFWDLPQVRLTCYVNSVSRSFWKNIAHVCTICRAWISRLAHLKEPLIDERPSGGSSLWKCGR